MALLLPLLQNKYWSTRTCYDTVSKSWWDDRAWWLYHCWEWMLTFWGIQLNNFSDIVTNCCWLSVHTLHGERKEDRRNLVVLLSTERESRCVGQSGQPTRQITIEFYCSNDVIPVTISIHGGFNPCNAIKVTSLPSFSNDLQFGNAYNSNCSNGHSNSSQFYLLVPSFNGLITATTCNLTTIDTIINVYNSEDCTTLGGCIVSDDGCENSSQPQSTVTFSSSSA